MSRISLIRAAAVASALFTASFISFPSFPRSGLFTVLPTSVDRTFKGDRLPLMAPALAPAEPSSAAPPAQLQTREKVPFGCDGAFSPISSPRLANVFRRCTV